MGVANEGPIWLVGCGNMAGAMLAGWLRSGVSPERFTVIRPSGQPPSPGVRTLIDLPIDGEVPGLVMLGVKPRKLDEVAVHVARVLAPKTVLVSILAGVEIGSLRERFVAPEAIVRAMPNLPVSLGYGATGLFADGANEAIRGEMTQLMGLLGLALWVDDEDALDAVSVLGGSGPAFAYRFIDALAAAGETIGLTADRARQLALATVEGAARLASQADDPPARLADRVASPGGSTRKGLDVLDADDALTRLMQATLTASRARVAEMAAEARARPA